MNIRRNVLEHQHDLVSTEHRPKICALAITALVAYLEAKPRLIELNRFCQIVNDKEGYNTI
jgi:hypothetical protein